MLGQIPSVTPGGLGEWLICAAAVMAIAVYAKKLFVRKPSIEAEFVTQTEFRSFKSEMTKNVDSIRGKMDRDSEKVMEKLDDMKTELMRAADTRTDSLYERLNAQDRLLARIDERTKGKRELPQ